MKIKLVFLSLILFTAAVFAQYSGIRGDIQIQAVKTIWGVDDNFDQLYGRANLQWAFQEDSAFSSLVHVRAYPAGFGFEQLMGASYNPPDTSIYKVPAVPNRRPPLADLPTIQIYQAWIMYKFPDFNIRVGRMTTNNTKSLHFGNYLDYPHGGAFTLSRDGIHNAFEGYNIFGVFDTRAHIGVGDFIGNRGFIRVFETIRPSEKFALGLGYRVNLFDMVHYEFSDSAADLTNKLALSMDIKVNHDVDLYLESAWSHTENDDNKDPIPVMLSLNYTLPKELKDFLKKNFKILDVLDVFRAEAEYLYDRKSYEGIYRGIDMDILWNLYGEKTWLKRMYFQGGLFAAPTRNRNYNVGVGIRFTSKIN